MTNMQSFIKNSLPWRWDRAQWRFHAGVLSVALGFYAISHAEAFAQAVIGGGGGMGLFAAVIDYFRANMVMGILYMGIASMFVGMMVTHCQLKTVLLVTGGCVGLINTPNIASALASMSGL